MSCCDCWVVLSYPNKGCKLIFSSQSAEWCTILSNGHAPYLPWREEFVFSIGIVIFHGGPNCRRVCHALTGMSILVPKCLDLGCWVWPKLTRLLCTVCVFKSSVPAVLCAVFIWARVREKRVCLFFSFFDSLKRSSKQIQLGKSIDNSS